MQTGWERKERTIKGECRGGYNEDAAVRSDNRDGDVKETKKGGEVGEMAWRRDEGVEDGRREMKEQGWVEKV